MPPVFQPIEKLLKNLRFSKNHGFFKRLFRRSFFEKSTRSFSKRLVGKNRSKMVFEKCLPCFNHKFHWKIWGFKELWNPMIFSRNCFEEHSLKGKTQAVDCRPVAWNISDPCACALQCTIRPATPHRERLRSLGCGSSVGQTLPVNQFFSWAAGMRKKHCPSIFFGFGKKHVGNIFLKPPHPDCISGFLVVGKAKPYVFSACTRANARLSLFPLNHCSCTSGSQFNLPPDFFSHKRRSRIISACWDSSSAPPQWKNLCKEGLKFKSYIFRFFWTLKKTTINQPQTSFWCWHVKCIGQIFFIGIHSLLTCINCKLCQSSSHCFGLDAHANTKAQ